MEWSIGYSYHVEWTLIWIAGFLIAGIAVLRVSGEGRRNGMPFGVAYSFDMLLPIVRLREKTLYRDRSPGLAALLFLCAQDHRLRAGLVPDRRRRRPHQIAARSG